VLVTVLRHVDLLIGNDREISSHTTAVARNGSVNNGRWKVMATTDNHETMEELLRRCSLYGPCRVCVCVCVWRGPAAITAHI
jgi:hypothetical protein